MTEGPNRFLSKTRETEEIRRLLRRTHRRRSAAAGARERSGRGSRAAQGEVAQPIRVFTFHGEHARHQGFFSGSGGLLSMLDSRVPATIHPGEHGIGIVLIWGASGWKESTRERLRQGNRAGVSAA